MQLQFNHHNSLRENKTHHEKKIYRLQVVIQIMIFIKRYDLSFLLHYAGYSPKKKLIIHWLTIYFKLNAIIRIPKDINLKLRKWVSIKCLNIIIKRIAHWICKLKFIIILQSRIYILKWAYYIYLWFQLSIRNSQSFER